MSHDFVGKEFQVGLNFFPVVLMDIAWRYSAGWSVSATLVVMARRLGLAGTSSRARNHRTQKHPVWLCHAGLTFDMVDQCSQRV